MYKTTAEEGKTSSNIYLILGGILGHGGAANPIISKCVNTGKILAAHDGTLDWDDATNNMKIDYSKTMQYRGALVGHGNTKLRVENCKVGGYVGAVKGGDGDDKYEASVLHKLNNDTADRYYWERWTNGYTTKQKYSNLEFIDVQ